MSASMSTKVLGSKGEQLGAEFLRKRGYEIIARNFRYERGEIDIIAQKDKLISFCEVKTRKSDSYGRGEDAVDSRKQNQIRKVAEGYIAGKELEGYEFRFDVVVVEIRRNSTKIRIIEDAF